MALDNLCNTGLVLGLGYPSTKVKSEDHKQQRPPTSGLNLGFEPSLTLGLLPAAAAPPPSGLYRQDSGASSYSTVSVKREREYLGSEEGETERVSSRVSDEDDEGINGRKKLRLTKAQSALLEESFKQHSTLNPKQKQELARELKLRPRQVEVWFQNRRARTKLKQTEVDCEYLKKCCETLTDENRRLQKEVAELKALKLSQPFYMQLPAATLSMCPACERIGGDNNKSSKPLFLNSNKFTNSSAAC